MGTLAERIDMIVSRMGVPERELGRRAGLGGATVGRLRERLKEDPLAANLRTLEGLARVAGVSLGWLASGEGETTPRMDMSPNRTAAAELARMSGVWNEAIRSVLTEEPRPEDAGRTAGWWLLRMKMRELEMIEEAVRRQKEMPPASERRAAPEESGEQRISAVVAAVQAVRTAPRPRLSAVVAAVQAAGPPPKARKHTGTK